MRPVNLLPEHLRPREASGRAGGAYVLLGVLGAVLLAVLVYVMAANQVTERKAETVELRQETERADARAGALAAFGDFRSVKETRLASVRQLATGRLDWERTVRELSKLLPGDVWLTEMDATATGESAGDGGASASSAASGSAPAGPGARLTGCAPSQGVLAETMVRLRRMKGTQEVRLITSEQGEAEEAGSGSSQGAAPQAGDCGEIDGRPAYQFEVQIVFDPAAAAATEGPAERKVPAALGGGS